jgi:GH24 family phage-related lysozyme (muramidase)
MWDDLKLRLKIEEGNVGWMYLDSLGLVTVGVGHLLAYAAAAAVLPFMLPSGDPAGVTAVCAEFNLVRGLAPAMLPGYYEAATKLRMSQASIDALLDADLASLALALEHRLAGFGGYPGSAQEALLDLGFQVGPSGLAAKFPKLCAAAEAGRWRICALECRTPGAADSRNQARARLFEQAATEIST